MNWSTFQSIDKTGLTGRLLHEAARLNKCISFLVQFRAAVEQRKSHPMRGRPGDLFDEAMRREVTLRIDIEKFEKSANRDTSTNAALITAAREFLTLRGTHTTGGAR